jgi:hypothetical protein
METLGGRWQVEGSRFHLPECARLCRAVLGVGDPDSGSATRHRYAVPSDQRRRDRPTSVLVRRRRRPFQPVPRAVRELERISRTVPSDQRRTGPKFRTEPVPSGTVWYRSMSSRGTGHGTPRSPSRRLFFSVNWCCFVRDPGDHASNWCRLMTAFYGTFVTKL